ncbi:MAG TPA: alpha/beta hydrolase [Kofleriaceae bacterium]|jgi:pimeloyl-ACP methyl ester carboxylesterase|nr:alpha/beta hydrolase [Kofleriaceae bacterium]
MRRLVRHLVTALAVALAACGHHTADAAETIAAAPSDPFQPTAFSVEVSGHGRPIIFIPGLGCPGALWRDTVAHLDGYESHVLTLAGFAGQPAIDRPLAATTRAELARYVRDRKLDHPIIVGHSMGGFIAYWLAAAEPRLVGPTIIVDSGASLGTGDTDADAETGRAARALWRDASDAQFAQQVHDIFSQMTAKPDLLAPLLDSVARSDRRAIGDAIYEQYTTDLRPMLTAIRSPVLVVLADGSLKDGMRAHATRVPDHQVVVVPGAKHFVMIDDPQTFYATIDAFLAAHPAQPASVAAL